MTLGPLASSKTVSLLAQSRGSLAERCGEFYAEEVTDSLAVRCVNLGKDYGSGHGLFDVNLDIHEGEVFGLIGPNGAGKSTLMKILMDFVRPSSGSVVVFGHDVMRDAVKLKEIVGYLPGELVHFPGVSAHYILRLLARMRGVKTEDRILELAARLQLDLDKKYEKLSHGNKQKVGLIQAFMHNPRLLILDEPTLGLDPLMQREVRALVKEAREAGSTVILSSHVLSEVETVCDRVGLISGGKIVRVGSLVDLRGQLVHKISIVFSSDAMPTSEQWAQAGVEDAETEGQTVSFELRGSIDAVLKLVAKFPVSEVMSRDFTLEEVFFAEIGS